MTIKQAVDSKAEQYYRDYFGDYGAQFVAAIPRRIAHALMARTAELATFAEAGAGFSVEPYGHSIDAAKRLTLEGRLVVQAKKSSKVFVFKAKFRKDGILENIDSVLVGG